MAARSDIRGRLLPAGLALAATLILGACRGKSDSPVVASYRDTELRLDQLQQMMPANVSPTDSARFAQHYIEEWLKAQAIADVAMAQMPDLEDQIEFKVEDYRQKLILHAFATRLLRDSLDTTITDADIVAFRQGGAADMVATGNLYSYFFIQCAPERAPEAEMLIRSSLPTDLEKLSAWAKDNAAIAKLDSSYTSEANLEELERGYMGGLKNLASGQVATWTSQKGNPQGRCIFKMLAKVTAGDTLPPLAAKEQIRSILLNERKVKLIEANETRIMNEAKSNNYIQQ